VDNACTMGSPEQQRSKPKRRQKARRTYIGER